MRISLLHILLFCMLAILSSGVICSSFKVKECEIPSLVSNIISQLFSYCGVLFIGYFVIFLLSIVELLKHNNADVMKQT